MIDHTHGIVREPASEPGKGRMIGRSTFNTDTDSLIKGKTQKFLEGDPVVYPMKLFEN